MRTAKKLITLLLCILLIASITLPAFAADTGDSGFTLEEIPLSAVNADTQLSSYFIEHNGYEIIEQAQEEIESAICEGTASYISDELGIEITPDVIMEINDRYELMLPETPEGNLIVKRDSKGIPVDTWYLYYVVTDNSFKINVKGVDKDNTLDKITGKIKRYYLNGKRPNWTSAGSSPNIDLTNRTNGTLYTYSVKKYYVKEKFEYDITVTDNGIPWNFDNSGKDDYVRYNFGAGAYNDPSFTANGGQRHHFIAAAALSRNGYDSGSAYCIRMMTEDHYQTGSYGSSTYINDLSNLIKAGDYEGAIKKEVKDLQSHNDCEGIAGTLQQKYYTEVVLCIVQYEKLFGIS